LQNGPARITDISYSDVKVNDEPDRVGWRFYRVSDQPTNSLGWDLFLTNAAPGTQLALRRGQVPSRYFYRPGTVPRAYYDVGLSPSDFLQCPDLQAGIWYIGVYNPSNALGTFTLTTRELSAMPLADNLPLARSNVLNGRWEFFKVTLTPEDVAGAVGPGPVLGWDLRLTNITSGLPRLVVRREGFPTNLMPVFSSQSSVWPSGQQYAAGGDWTGHRYSADGVIDEDGRIMAMGVGRPLVAGTYYIGVLNSAGTNAMSYNLLSRWIGPGRAISIQDLDWNGGRVTNTVAPREAVYYRVVLPANVPSWKVHLTNLWGETLLLASTNPLPAVDSEKRMQKTGDEQYVRLPAPGSVYLFPGTNFLAVIGEGNLTNSANIGTGQSRFVLETLGSLPEVDLGTLAASDLVTNGTLQGGEVAAFHFNATLGTMGLWVTLENKNGNPWMVARGGGALADPGYGGDTYGNEGGESGNAVASADGVIWSIPPGADPASSKTIMVKARKSGSAFPDASYTLRVSKIVPQAVAFDGGTAPINNPAQGMQFFYVDVESGAFGWDLRLTNVTSGLPQLVVCREALPIKTVSSPNFPSSQYSSTSWPVGAVWTAGADWTERSSSADGVSEYGRVVAMG
ncbi:MAG TPA: hypothetical protein VNT26_03270, partial [Candidatus Sulfotelmatobacter sp.]|nr:hypothetical protein [Candidatus Sulfotelmatobacter sp.]